MLVQSLLFVTCFAAPEVAELEFDVEKDVVYSTVDDRDLLLDAYVPSGDTDRPAVLVVHGGAWRMGNRKQLQGYARALAKKGFVCFAIDYRLAPKHKFPAQIDDCRAAVQWIRNNATKYSIDALKRAGVKTFLHKVEGAGHIQAAANPEALKKAYGFLVQELLETNVTPAE